MNIREVRQYFSNKPIEFVIKEKYDLLEDKEFIPRFTLKDKMEIAGIPINEPIKYSDALMKTAMEYGMILNIVYKGAKDKYFAGHERTVYVMCHGRSSKGKGLLRVWHLSGWSVSNNNHVQKIWRLFRTDRILSVTFTGSFFRLPPNGYVSQDSGMRGGIIKSADFIEIRKNQQKLVTSDKIQDKEEITLGDEKVKFATIKVKNTNSKLDLNNPLENAYVNNVKDIANLRVSFLKSIYGNTYIALIGAVGQPGNTVKVIDDKNKNLGVFKVLDSIGGNVLKKIKKVKGNTIYDVYLFENKI